MAEACSTALGSGSVYLLGWHPQRYGSHVHYLVALHAREIEVETLEGGGVEREVSYHSATG